LENIFLEINAAAQGLVGRRCWGMVGGSGTGSNISLEFGNKIKRSKPLLNRNLTDDLRYFQGEYGFFVECSWRVEDANLIICGSKSSGEDISFGLNKLINEEVESIEILEVSFDLILRFTNKFALKIFCDEVDVEENIDNYTLSSPSLNYIVGCKSKMRFEKRNYY
jgi:hypothetical protein